MEAIGERGELDLSRVRPVEEVFASYSYFRDGDIAIAKVTPCFENGKGAMLRGLQNGIGFGTTELTVLRPRPGLDPKYLYYVTASPAVRRLGVASMTGAGGLRRVKDDFYLNLYWAVPPESEQRQIANHLDRELPKIDALIAKQERLIDLLTEKKQSAIHHAASRGCDPAVPLKESGVPWIGQTPVHWRIRRLKEISRLESGHTPSRTVPEYWVNCDIPWVSLNDSKQLANVDYIGETAVKISQLGMDNSSARLLPTGSVVFTRDATIGLAAITTRPMAVSQHIIAWAPTGEVLPLFLLRVLNAMRPFLDFYTAGATIKTIGMEDIRKLTMAVPPLPEQQRILDVLEPELQAIDKLIAQCRRAIDLLWEHRASLIAAVVTGKVRVTEVVGDPEEMAGA